MHIIELRMYNFNASHFLNSFGCFIELTCQLFVQTHADVLGLSLILPNETESVLLGAAMLGATASEKAKREHQDVWVSFRGHSKNT